MESSPRAHLDTIWFVTARSLTADRSRGPFSHVMFKAFLGPSNPLIQHTRFSLCQNFLDSAKELLMYIFLVTICFGLVETSHQFVIDEL